MTTRFNYLIYTLVLVTSSLFLVVNTSVAQLRSANQYQQTVFANPLTDISAPTASAPIQNIGQSMHLIEVTFSAEATTQSPINVTLEWSRDGVNWRPAGGSIVSAPVLNQGIGATDVIAYALYYGAFRAIRVNSSVATPGGALMTVRYIGTIIPSIPYVTLEPTRWVF